MPGKIKNRLLDIRLSMKYQFQKDFADFLGYNRSHYNRWEKNIMQPNPATMDDICKKLNMKWEDVFYRADD